MVIRLKSFSVCFIQCKDLRECLVKIFLSTSVCNNLNISSTLLKPRVIRYPSGDCLIEGRLGYFAIQV